MFKKLLGSIDKVEYNPDLDFSSIEGWVINPPTREAVDIELDVPGECHSYVRYDVNKLLNLPFHMPYGFLIIIPGDYRILKPTVTFRCGSIEEKEEIIDPERRYYLFLKRKFNEYSEKAQLRLKRILGIPIEEKSEEEESVRDWTEVEDRKLENWINCIEPMTFNSKTNYPVNLTYIVVGDEHGLRETVASIKETDPDGQILIATNKEFDYDDHPVYRVLPSRDLSEEEALFKALDSVVDYATGDYLVFVDTKDLLAPQFRNEVARALEKNPDADFLYADNDQISIKNRRYGLNYKPDFDPIMLRHMNFILSPVIIRKDLFDKVGRFREEYMGLMNYDLILRATAKAENIVHIPHILYHWQKDQSKTSMLPRNSKLGADILNDIYGQAPHRHKISEFEYAYTSDYVGSWPSVTIITGIYKGVSEQIAQETIKSILEFMEYPNYQILAVNVPPFTEDKKVKFIETEKFSSQTELDNFAAKEAKGDYLLFINPGFKAIDMNWLKEMVSLAEIDNVGIVGPKIFNDYYTFDSCGISLKEDKRYDVGRGELIKPSKVNYYVIPKTVFAVREDALLISRKLFEDLGGFDTALSPQSQSLDLSIRARKKGKYTVSSRNTPVMVSGIENLDGTSVSDLAEIHPSEELVDKTLNINNRFSDNFKL